MIEQIIVIGGSTLVLAAIAGALWWRWMGKRPLKQEYFQKEWSELQQLLRNKNRWDVALIRADNLLDIALKKRHIRGHNMGERLVKAQRLFADNDGVWFGHKLRNKVESDPEAKLKNAEVKQALLGIRQALKDLGALAK